jgi:hypothetical protein
MMRRNYSVLSISEMCCCGDGLDYEPTAANGKRRMSHNILGYNMTNFSSGGGGNNNDNKNKNSQLVVPRGYRLGGDSTFCIYMTPAEAAVALTATAGRYSV